MTAHTNTTMEHERSLRKGKGGEGAKDFVPALVAFCCSHSAYEAADMAGTLRLPFPSRLRMLSVPCTGKVDIIHILKAFELGADGVAVIACHEDNCKKIDGNIRARQRVEHTKGLLEEIGMEKERLEIYNLAPNMGYKFAEIVNTMEQRIMQLGPNPLLLKKNG